jgi:hypothetical protein
LKISDFSTSRICRNEVTFNSGELEATLKYTPPEVIQNKILSSKVFII